MQASRFAAEDRLALAPPPQPGLLRAFGLAVIAHLLLLFALMNGLQWQRESQNAAVEAELWSALPQQAAPREVVPPPPPPQPVVKAPPKPEPPVVKAPPEPPARRDADIAIEREKHKRELEQRKQAELEREREQRRKLEAQKKREDELARKKLEQQKLLAEAKRKEEEKKHKLQEQEARDAKRLAQIREENLRRMQGMAGTGAPSATGSAMQSSGPSANYGARIAAIIKRNTHFVDTISGDPPVEVEVRLAPDGTIVGRRIVKSSGNKARDEAVLRGIEATERLPRDVDGRVHTPMIISVRQFG